MIWPNWYSFPLLTLLLSFVKHLVVAAVFDPVVLVVVAFDLVAVGQAFLSFVDFVAFVVAANIASELGHLVALEFEVVVAVAFEALGIA